SVGIQWLLQPERYFSHAQRYLSGRSWFTSARALIMRLSSTDTRAAPRSISPRPVASASCAAVPSGGTDGVVFGSDQSSISIFSLISPPSTLPLIALPGTSPREERGEGSSSSVRAPLSPSFTGRG